MSSAYKRTVSTMLNQTVCIRPSCSDILAVRICKPEKPCIRNTADTLNHLVLHKYTATTAKKQATVT